MGGGVECKSCLFLSCMYHVYFFFLWTVFDSNIFSGGFGQSAPKMLLCSLRYFVDPKRGPS